MNLCTIKVVTCKKKINESYIMNFRNDFAYVNYAKKICNYKLI